MFASTTTFSRRFRARALFASLFAFSFVPPIAANATEPGATWWVEVVREREIPTALIAIRKAAAAEELRKAKAEEEKVEPGAKGKVKALFRALKKVKPAAEEADKDADEAAEAPDIADPKAGEEKVDDKEEAPEAAGGADAATPKGDVPDEAAAEDPPAEEAPAKAPPVEEKEEAEEEAMTISITVAMAGEIVGLNNSSLMFRPAVQPDEVLELPLKQVASLSRHAPGRAPAAEDPDDLEFRVVLRDGSEVPGQLMSLTDKAITVALVGSGAKIDLPLGEITRVERNVPIGKAAGADLPEFPGRHIAVLSTGEVVAGQLLPSRDSDKWLRISSPILTAECPLSLIDLLIFPDPEAPAGGAEDALADEVELEDDGGNNGNPAPPKAETVPEPEVEPEPDIRHLVSLTPAGMLWAKSLKVEGDNLLVSALGKESFLVPLDRVESVSFGHDGLPTTAPVLVWGGYSDADDEYKKTIDSLSGRIPARKLIQNKSKVPDADFMRHLRRARVLLVPEMESFKRTQLKEAMDKDGKGCPSWKDAFRGFLRRGGSIIFLSPTGEALNFFNESGLGPLRSGGSGSGWEITADGKKLGAKVAGTIANVNATHYFRKGEPWQVWGAAKGGGDGAVLLGRRLERGWVMAFGADFYETNKDLTETLVRMIEFRGRR